MASSKKYSKEAQVLADDKRLIFRAARKIRELGLVGNIRQGLTVFLACLTMYLEEKVSIMVVGPSGSGKSTVIEKPLKLFPRRRVTKRASMSAKAIAYGKKPLKGKILYVTEYRGGREAQLMLRILQSEGRIDHEYTRGNSTRTAARVGTPVLLTTNSGDKVFDDDLTRLLLMGVDESPEQVLGVLKATIRDKRPKKEPSIKTFRQAIEIVADRAKKEFLLPDFLEVVAELVPRDKSRAMRDWKRVLGLLKAVAVCRPQSGAVNEITFSDYCVVHRLVNSALTATAHDISENELAVQKAVCRLNHSKERAITIREVQEFLDWTGGATYKHVRAAVKHGLLKYEEGTREKNIKLLLPVDGVGRPFLPSPKRVLKHVKKLGDSVTFVDPLTGKTKRISAS